MTDPPTPSQCGAPTPDALTWDPTTKCLFGQQLCAADVAAAATDAADFLAHVAAGLGAGAEGEGDVPSPLDVAAFFSDIANYDYAPLGHQAHTLFDALAKVWLGQKGVKFRLSLVHPLFRTEFAWH